MDDIVISVYSREVMSSDELMSSLPLISIDEQKSTEQRPVHAGIFRSGSEVLERHNLEYPFSQADLEGSVLSRILLYAPD